MAERSGYSGTYVTLVPGSEWSLVAEFGSVLVLLGAVWVDGDPRPLSVVH